MASQTALVAVLEAKCAMSPRGAQMCHFHIDYDADELVPLGWRREDGYQVSETELARGAALPSNTS